MTRDTVSEPGVAACSDADAQTETVKTESGARAERWRSTGSPGRWAGWARSWRRDWRAGAVVLLIVYNFVCFFPIYSGATIPYSDRHSRMWCDTCT
ncbi:hypothetical protein [Streptomyces sp. NPDC017991]|uniref:hypothetical protein n=1 Tax=Streptomyces sp. NPDC017991 TaxID=3365026 RepID=UPI0037A6823C